VTTGYILICEDCKRYIYVSSIYIVEEFLSNHNQHNLRPLAEAGRFSQDRYCDIIISEEWVEEGEK